MSEIFAGRNRTAIYLAAIGAAVSVGLGAALAAGDNVTEDQIIQALGSMADVGLAHSSTD
jgi:hypothetical protein